MKLSQKLKLPHISMPSIKLRQKSNIFIKKAYFKIVATASHKEAASLIEDVLLIKLPQILRLPYGLRLPQILKIP